jgi:hypothetical protein
MIFKHQIQELKEFNWKIHLLKWDWKKARIVVKKVFWDYLDEFQKVTEWFTAKWEREIVIYIKKIDCEVVIHEMTHALNHIFENSHIVTEIEWANETLAYFFGYHCTEALKFYSIITKN